MEGSIKTQLLDSITGELFSELTSWLKRATSDSKAAKWLKGKIGIEELHTSIKDILSTGISTLIDQIKTEEVSKVKIFFKNRTNNNEIIRWISESIDQGEFSISAFDMDEKNEAYFKPLLQQLFNTIRELKNQTFDAGTLNILSQASKGFGDIKSVLREEIMPESAKEHEITRELIVQEFSEIRMDLRSGVFEEKIISEKNKEVIEEIKKQISDGYIIAARKRLFELLEDTSNDSEDREYIFLLYAYLTETFLRERGQNNEAIKYLKMSAKYSVEKYKKFRNEAFAYSLSGDYNKALKMIDKAYNLAPNNWTVLNLRVEIIREIEGSKRALNELTKQINVHKDNFEYLFQKGWLCYLNGQIDDAIDLLEKSIDIQDNPKSRSLLSDILLRKSELNNKNGIPPKITDVTPDLNSSIDHLEKALDLYGPEENQSKASCHYAMGVAFARLGQSDRALEELNQSERLGLVNPEFHWYYGLLCLQNKQYNTAFEQFDKGIKSGGDVKEFIPLKVHALTGKGDTQKALNLIEQYLQNVEDYDKNYIELYLAKAELLIHDLKTTKAENLYDNLYDKWKNDPKIRVDYARFLVKMGNYDMAISLLDNSLSVDYKDLEYIRIRILAEAYHKRGLEEDYSQVEMLLSPIIDENRLDGLNQFYAESLRQQEKLEECLNFCSKIKNLLFNVN